MALEELLQSCTTDRLCKELRYLEKNIHKQHVLFYASDEKRIAIIRRILRERGCEPVDQ